MVVTNDPNLIVGGYGLGLLALAVLWRLVAWIREGATHAGSVGCGG